MNRGSAIFSFYQFASNAALLVWLEYLRDILTNIIQPWTTDRHLFIINTIFPIVCSKYSVLLPSHNFNWLCIISTRNRMVFGLELLLDFFLVWPCNALGVAVDPLSLTCALNWHNQCISACLAVCFLSAVFLSLHLTSVFIDDNSWWPVNIV